MALEKKALIGLLVVYALSRAYLIAVDRPLSFDGVTTRISASGESFKINRDFDSLKVQNWFTAKELNQTINQFSPFSYEDIIEYYQTADIHPPLYFLLYHFFSSVFGFSIITGACLQLFLELLFILVSSSFLRKIPTYFSIFFCGSILLNATMTETFLTHRQYMLFALLSLTAIKLFYELMEQRKISLWHFIAFSVTIALGAFTHFLFLLVLFCLFLSEFLLKLKISKSFGILSIIAISIITIIVSSFPEIYSPVFHVSKGSELSWETRIHGFLSLPSRVLTPGVHPYYFLDFIAWPLLIFLLVFGFKSEKILHKRISLFSFLFFLLFGLSIVLEKFPAHTFSSFKYFLLPSLFILLIIFDYLSRRRSKKIALFLAMGFSVIIILKSSLYIQNRFIEYELPAENPLVFFVKFKAKALRYAHLIDDENRKIKFIQDASQLLEIENKYNLFVGRRAFDENKVELSKIAGKLKIPISESDLNRFIESQQKIDRDK